MNKKSLFIKLFILIAVVSSAFVLSSCFSTGIFVASCSKACNSCSYDDDGNDISGNEYGIYYTLSEDGGSYLVSEIGYMETTVKIPETYQGRPVTGIKSGAFTHYVYGSGCSGGHDMGLSLTSLTLPKTIKVIENGVFNYSEGYYYSNVGGRCDKLIFEGTLEDWFSIEFGSSPFDENTDFYMDGKLITAIEVPESVTRISARAFAWFAGLKSVTLHENVAVIEEGAFKFCRNLEEITFPCKDLTLCRQAFFGCGNLKSVSFTGEKLVLEDEAFSECRSLIEVNWNAVDISIIPSFAFANCTNLETFVIPKSVKVIREHAFDGCYVAEIYNLSQLDVVKGSSANGGVAFNAVAVHSSFDEGSSILTVGDYKFVVSETGAELFKYKGDGGALNLPVLESGENYVISDNTFSDNDDILSVNIPACVTAIGNNAFSGCGKLQVVSGCEGLLTVGNCAFRRCVKLETVILAKIEKIGEGAFSGCNSLAAVELPVTLTEVGKGAFDGCLAAITYAGTLEDWSKVTLSELAEADAKVTCSDGEWEGKI